MKKLIVLIFALSIGYIGISAQSTKELKWYSLDEALELNKTTPKKLLVDVYTKWCGPCKMMMSYTFTDSIIIKTVDKYFYPVKFNAEGNDSIVFNDSLFTNPSYDPLRTAGRNGTHQFTMYIAPVNGQVAYPTIVYFDEELNYIQGIQGLLYANQLEPILKFFGTNSYKSIDWETYLSTFESEIK